MIKQTKHCPLCGERAKTKHLDHIIPINIGGTHTRGNVRVICAKCNLSRPHDGSDLNGHQPTLWATDARAAEAATALRARKPSSISARKPSRRKIKAQARRLLRQSEANVAYLHRLHGASWSEIVQRFGFASAGHAHNVVYGGDKRAFAPGRSDHFKPRSGQ